MSAVERVRAAYARMREVDRPEVWITVRDEDDALAEAAEVDLGVAAGERLPLAGTVVAVKDNIDVEGMPTTAGSRAYAYRPERDATAVARLRAAGAVVVGKTNLDQFATGLVGTRSPFGAVRNAWDPTRISGGSSSGSAVAVALGIVDLALGTDTAGSGRVPAALNGIVGVKPTVGLVPATGVVPACRTLDCVTVFARDLSDARAAAELMAGPDGIDPLGREDRPAPPLDARPRVAVPTPEHLEGLADGWAEAFAGVVAALAASGVEIVEVDIAPLLEAASLLYGGAFVAERTAAVGDFIAAHPELVGTDLDSTVAGIVLAGAEARAADYFRDRERLDRLGAEGLRRLDGTVALLTPTTTWHPTLDEVAADPVGANSRMGRYTNFANLLDRSALAVPAGVVGGRAFGVMLTGAPFADRTLAQLAERIQAPSVDLLVVGAHLRGQPLNHQLVAAGGTFVAEVETAAQYRLHALDTVPPKPGLARAAEGGAAIAGEVWRLPAAGFGRFVADLPAPMGIGSAVLSDGSSVAGFLCEAVALEGATDITAHGGWRAYRAATA
ncbi:allophanate hydrolase [Microbacterium sp. CSI-V]|uniref:allophanate hydrolase n=1 Tax=unclassified Microbacterium TaxID=2609290 RepID=UPI00097BF0C2|nr:allophanate hydrolase [Microbacterium sp. CSI-V]MXS76204.1 allophanate hydrolase [Microbacterium sp. TL13]ONI64475.1 allophanate hydrolase [Microbacterium sp. CSI-V]